MVWVEAVFLPIISHTLQGQAVNPAKTNYPGMAIPFPACSETTQLLGKAGQAGVL